VNLAGFDLYRYGLPLRRPPALEGTTLHRREGLLVRLSGDDGSEGWGESAPLPGFSEESLDEAAEQLRRLAGSLVGRDVTGDWVDGGSGREMDRSDPSVRFGLELAFWNLYADHSGLDLPELVSSSPSTTVPVNGLISSPMEALEEARRMSDAGYESVKLKVGTRPVAEDFRLVRELGVELDNISLRLDANRAWSYEEAAEFVRGAPRFEYLEEPLADPRRLPELVHEFGVPVALDESLVGMEPEDLEAHRYAQAVVLKPTLLGGIERTLRLAGRALDLGMTPVVSSAYESGVGTAALVALAAGIGEHPVPAGLDTYRALAEDVLDTPLALPAPHLDVGQAIYASRRVAIDNPKRLQHLREL
jgi:o-succinylbenzoate synthase